MDVIVSHVNADFDSLGGTVGAARLYPGAVMVLPGGEAANVREFLALHKDVLEVRTPSDVDPGAITRIVAVDCCRRSRLGAAAEWLALPGVEVHAYDHHAESETDLSPSVYECRPWGAASSVVAHALKERNETLSAVEATALLLGIYEDTGCLSFADTRAEDVEAAAWLLRSGAELDAVNRFVHRALTPEQRALLSQALSCLRVETVHSLQVALAELPEGPFVEGAAGVVDRLLDTEEQRAAFLIAPMDGVLYVIGRSRSEAVDVGGALREIGGGGHTRAGSASLKGGDPAETRRRLSEALPRYVRSEATARELMSYPVRTVAPETPVAEALRLMTRYGHSGLVVMQGDTVAGIVTRRDLDRAHHHRLEHAPVAGFMTRHVESVTPEATLSEIEHLMIAERIGRVPVVLDEQVVGIVTRTDVLTARYGRRYLAGAPDLHDPSPARLLRERLPAAVQKLLEEIGRQAERTRTEAFAVGGFVRDLFLELPNLDLDILAEPDGIALARALAEAAGGRIKVEPRFGTASVTLPEGQRVDFATARSEVYPHPGALPEVEPSSVVDDLRRRDFTINALALSLSPERFGELLDPFGGRRDLERGRVRVIHNLSFQEDPTRLFRAVRFEERLHFGMVGRTEALARHAVEDGALGRITPERLREQLFLGYSEPRPLSVLLRLRELGVFDWLAPELELDESLLQAIPGALDWWREHGAEEIRPEVVYTAALLAPLGTDAAAPVARERLRLPEPALALLAASLSALARADELLAEAAPSVVTARLRPLPPEALVLLRGCLRAGKSRGDELRLLDRFTSEWRNAKLEVTGDDLRKAGFAPGPAMGAALKAALDSRLDGKIHGREQELELASRLLEAQAAGARQRPE